MNSKGITFSLLDALAAEAQREYLSDLRSIDDLQRMRLARVLEQIDPEAAELSEWNDALAYLGQEPPQQSQAAARMRLIEALRGKRTAF